MTKAVDKKGREVSISVEVDGVESTLREIGLWDKYVMKAEEEARKKSEEDWEKINESLKKSKKNMGGVV